MSFVRIRTRYRSFILETGYTTVGDNYGRGFNKVTRLVREAGGSRLSTDASTLGRNFWMVAVVSASIRSVQLPIYFSRPQYHVCGWKASDIRACLDLTDRAIVIAGWLASTARRELAHFKEFMVWLRYGKASKHCLFEYPLPTFMFRINEGKFGRRPT